VNTTSAETIRRGRLRPTHEAGLDRAAVRHLRDVTFHLVRRELSLRYRGSILGWLWSLSPALMQLVVTQFLFTRIIPLGVPNYPVFLLVGILSWNCFSSGLLTATTTLEARRNLVLRPGFATILLPLVATLVAVVDYAIAVPIMFTALALTTGLTVESVLLPVLILIQLILTAGIALVVAPLQVFFKDIRQVVFTAISLGFWLTPVFYRARQVPEALKPLYKLNPMAVLIEAQRSILLAGQWPPVRALVAVAAGAVVTLAVGIWVFSRFKHSLPEKL
jgi:ABC-type polysaccharide/polyol phosphate export permease